MSISVRRMGGRHLESDEIEKLLEEGRIPEYAVTTKTEPYMRLLHGSDIRTDISEYQYTATAVKQ